MDRKLSAVYTRAVEEAEYKGETEVDEVVEKVIKRNKSSNTAFHIGVII